MARIAGVNIPTKKRVKIALTYIHGIGMTSANKICEKAGLTEERRVNDLTEDELTRISAAKRQWLSSAILTSAV